MVHRNITTLMVLAVAGLVLTACVSKTEHDKIVSELQQAQQEKTNLSEMLADTDKANNDLIRKVAVLEEQAAALQKENLALKEKAAKSKPATSNPAKKLPAKKKT
jgi:Na+-translocating ferredoxin:NAD+ oxidoreductase RnfG subunit